MRTEGRNSPSALRERPCRLRGLLLHGQSQLQRLLLPPLDDLFPQLSLVLHPLELGLDVLLRDLEQSEHAVVRLLRDHVQDVAETLRAALPPRLVDTERHVLRALLPAKQLHISLALIEALGVVESGAREDTHHLR